jgi:molybdenum cofactor cytidylyltransferase
MLLSHALRIQTGDVITLTGGGGKTTLMFRLAGELRAAGLTVITTTTTRVSAEQTRLAPARLVVDEATMMPNELAAAVSAAMAGHGHVFLYSDRPAEAGKVGGLRPQTVGELAARHAADVILVEGDGARRLPFKAPGEHEPVVPASTTILIPVVGLDALGAPLDDAHVHRPERIAQLTGATLGALITPALIAAVLAHPLGGAKGLPPAARLTPILNKAETMPALTAAHEIARLLLDAPQVDNVIIAAGQVETPDAGLPIGAPPALETWTRIGAVVLASGRASRYGALKQLLPWRDGTPLVAHAADQALACPDIARVAVTLGAGADGVRAALGQRVVLAVETPDWAAGQSRSVRAGLAALLAGAAPDAGPIGAAIFLLADQPGVSPQLLSALIARHRETLAPVVAPRYGGRRGNPVLFDASTFPAFDALQGDIGARPILQSYQAAIAWVDWPTPEVVEDIDTPEDYQNLTSGG